MKGNSLNLEVQDSQQQNQQQQKCFDICTRYLYPDFITELAEDQLLSYSLLEKQKARAQHQKKLNQFYFCARTCEMIQ